MEILDGRRSLKASAEESIPTVSGAPQQNMWEMWTEVHVPLRRCRAVSRGAMAPIAPPAPRSMGHPTNLALAKAGERHRWDLSGLLQARFTSKKINGKKPPCNRQVGALKGSSLDSGVLCGLHQKRVFLSDFLLAMASLPSKPEETFGKKKHRWISTRTTRHCFAVADAG